MSVAFYLFCDSYHQPNWDLLQASKKGDLEKVKRLSDSGVDLDFPVVRECLITCCIILH